MRRRPWTASVNPKRTLEFPGVRATARFHSMMRDRRDPTRQPSQAKTRRIEPEAQSVGSREGVRGAHSTCEGGRYKPPEGRGPASVVVGLRGKREGMAAYGPPNNPSDKSARTLQQPMDESQMVRPAQVVTPRLASRGDAAERTPGLQGRKSAMYATSGRPSVSRVREIRKHGLNGGLRKPDLEIGTGA